ncbi:MAG: hypothetical protein WC028_26970 [Candidatus Obscuribacterales bacterium]
MEAGFTGQDLVLLRSLKYDPSLKPAYESIKGCLIWEDERADELSTEAKRMVNNLLIARSLLHQGLTLDAHPINPELCKNLWALAQQQVSEWPGFRRLTLSAEDKAYFEDQVARAEREDL